MPNVEEIRSEEALEEELSRPYPEDISFAGQLEGDCIVLGAGGKMGPTLVRRIVRAVEQAGSSATVYAVSRFSDQVQRDKLEDCGAVTISADLLDESALAALPDCANVLYLVGMKFGATGKEALTWAMNTYLPGRVAERYRDARIVALSTGNVYPPVPVESGGAKETDPTGPVGEYAQSCLGRERMFQHFSKQNGTPVCLIRLNYAVEPRYGVLLDIAEKVHAGKPVTLEMGYVNVVWQGYANSVCFRALSLCTSPPEILNLTGPEQLSVREVARTFGERFGREPIFSGQESGTALLNDARRCHRLFGEPDLTPAEVIDMVADWVERGGPTLGKPTKFELRDGKF